MNVPERLSRYTAFDHDVLEQVAAAAAWQDKHTFQELADIYEIGDGPRLVAAPGSDQPLEVVTFTPRGDHDTSRARVLRLPMGHTPNPNMTMRAMRLFAADPSEQLIVVGNPTLPGNHAGTLPIRQSLQMMRAKSLTPVVEPSLRLFSRQGIETTSELGFSLGGDLAATAAAQAIRHTIQVDRAVFAESASGFRRGLMRLTGDFGKSAEQLKVYRKDSDSKPYAEAISHETKLWQLKYCAGLGRLSNLAIAMTLADGGFGGRVSSALEAQPGMRATIAWGTESELGNDQISMQLVDELQQEFGDKRVLPMQLRGMHHAGADDINLHAAIMLQGLVS